MTEWNDDKNSIVERKRFKLNAGHRFTLVKERLPKTFVKDENNRLYFINPSRPEYSHFINNLCKPCPVDYNRFWTKFNES